LAHDPVIRFERVGKRYGDGDAVVEGVTLSIERSHFVVVLGPSGCGKTTLLKMVNRLVEPTSGSIFINGVDSKAIKVTQLRRSMGYVIQQIGLFPHMTVAKNVSTVPELLRWEPARTSARVRELLELVRLPYDEFGLRHPAALSGGQQQRIGLARALAADPDILLMDEPFGALDAIERVRLQAELSDLHQRLHKTVVFVTHDVEEALHLADRIVVMRAGRIEQYGRPIDILERPANAFVAELVSAQDAVRRLGVIKIGDVLPLDGASSTAHARTAAPIKAPSDAAPLTAQTDLRTALSLMLAAGVRELPVLSDDGAALGAFTLEQLLQAARTPVSQVGVSDF